MLTASPAPRTFAALNLRWNPFGEVAEHDRGKLVVPVFDLDRVAGRLSTPGVAIELVGECGRGKSTHLWALRDRFPRCPVTYVDLGENPRVPKASVVFVDESQRIAPRQRARLFRRSASFVLATHASHAEELRSAGLEVETHEVAAVDLERLRRFVRRRLEWARYRSGPLPVVSDDVLRSLISSCGDDLRAIGDALYDRFQRRRDRGEL